MSLTEEQLARLPKYASDYVRLLENTLDAARARLQQGPEDSTATLEPYHDTNRKPLGRSPHIRFRSDNGNQYDLRHDAEGDVIKISGNGTRHADTFVALPDCSNAITITHHRLEK